MHSGRSVVVVGFLSSVVLCLSAAHAGEAVVKAPETVVRSAPSEAAPEIARLRAGERLPADDRPQGAWRRLQLPDGRFGLIHDADVEVTAGPPPPPRVMAAPPAIAAPPVTTAQPATTSPRPATAPQQPQGYTLPPPPPGYPPNGYPPPGYAYGPPRGFHTHDGTYVRLQIGPSYTNMWANDALFGKVQFTGAGASIGVAVGGALLPDFILYGTFLYAGASNPDVSVGGMTLGSASGDINLVGLGAGVAYYLQPMNLYFAGSALAARLTISDPNGNLQGATDYGLGLEGLVGKEWWVSDNWGLGASFQFLWATMKDKDTFGTGNPPTWTALGGSLLFSATFN